MSLYVNVCISEGERQWRVKGGRGGESGEKTVESGRLENESREERRAGERDKEAVARDVIGFEKPFNISTYGLLRLCASI